MALPQDYWKWYGNLQANSDSVFENQKFLSLNAELLKLDKTKTLISVGAGTGVLDSYLVSKCMTEIEHYIGVESHKPSCDELHTTMGKFTKMKVSIVNESFLEWAGPDSPVDVILASHMFYPYHIADPLAMIRRFYGWLKPGGSLMIVLGCGNCAFGEIAEEVFQVRSSRFEHVKGLLEKEGLSFTDHGRSYLTLYTDCNNEEMLKLHFKYLVHGLTDAQMNTLVRTFKDRHKGLHCEVVLTTGYLTVNKPEI